MFQQKFLYTSERRSLCQAISLTRTFQMFLKQHLNVLRVVLKSDIELIIEYKPQLYTPSCAVYGSVSGLFHKGFESREKLQLELELELEHSSFCSRETVRPPCFDS